MIMRRFFTKKTGIHFNYLHNKCTVFSYPPLSRSYSAFLYGCHRNTSLTSPQCLQLHSNWIYPNFVWNQKHYSNGRGLLDGDVTELQNKAREHELDLIAQQFPNPRVTLNELCTKTPEKMFDIYYKQSAAAPKAGKKKKVPKVSEWTCTYAFVWPEKMKFESTSISKKQASEKAATQALHWLYHNKRIDKHGLPLYDRDKINEMKSTLNEPLTATISYNSIERVQKIWEDYEGGIRDIFVKTHEEAIRKTISTPLAITKDSTIDEEDEYSERETCEESGDGATSELKTHVDPIYGKPLIRPTELALKRREQALHKSFEYYDRELAPLPIDDYAENITETIQNNRVTVIVGAAGCGKSTRAPAAILKSCGVAMKALVSEPRKVAAIGLAQRVASELGEEVGETVGYQVRLRAKPPRPPGGSILYCTSGVLLRRLQLNPGLEGCTHVFIDEAHERDVNTDITLLLLKRALDLNPELKVVVMSATLDTEVFTRYFDSCPIVEVPGRTFPVKITHLENLQQELGSLDVRQTLETSLREDGKPCVYSEEVVNIIKAVDRSQPEGAILVFLPGWADIKAITNLLNDTFRNSSTHLILPVHSRLSIEDQTKMFARPLPGVRKIVLSTNIAETSITIPDVVYVVDSGAHKENRIKEGTGTATLETVWVSQAAAKQRTGRAGRVQPGHCFRLYTKEKESTFAPHTTPEILRIPLVQTVLDCKTYAPDDKVASFLSQLPEPPSQRAIDIAVGDLVDLGALSSTEQLTPLGRYLSTFTLHPRLSVCLLHSAIIGNVVSTANIATHLSDNVDIFRQSIDRRQEIREIKAKYSPTSDHTALHWIQDEFEQTLNSNGWSEVDTWCERYGLRKDRLNYVKALSNVHLEQLLTCGIVDTKSDPDQLIRFSDIDELTVATLLSGSNSLLVSKRHLKTKGKMMTVKEVYTSSGDRAHIGSDSVNSAITKQRPGPKPDLLVYFGGYHSTERRALVLYKTSLVNTLTALLFCKGSIRRKELTNSAEELTVLSLPKHRLEVHVPATQADLILKVREMIWNTFQYYYERDTRHLETEIDTEITKFRIRLIKTVGRILVEAENNKSDCVQDEDFR